MEHVVGLLSEFIDEALPDADRREVEGHLSGCPECRRELEDLRRVSKMVAGLPRRPLPVGFLERLKRRREAGEAPAPSAFLLPAPARLAAVAFSSLAVVLVVYQGIKNRAPGLSGLSNGASPESVGLKFREPPFPSAKSLGTGRREPAGAPAAAGGASAPRLDEKAESAVTNESIHEFLEREKKKMGIQSIIRPSAAPEPIEAPGFQRRPPPVRSREETNAAMRGMADEMGQIVEARKAPSVRIGGTKTVLLSSPESAQVASGAPLAAAPGPAEAAPEALAESAPAAAPAAVSAMTPAAAGAGGRMERKDAGLAYLKSGKATGPKALAAEEAKEAEPALQAMRAAQGAGEAGGVMITTDARAADQKSGPRREARAAPAAKPVAPRPEGEVARTADDLKALWARLGAAGAPPEIDFDRQMLIAVYFPGGNPKLGVEIVRVASAEGRLVVEYRSIGVSGDSAEKIQSYQTRVVDRSDLDVVFKNVSEVPPHRRDNP